MVLEITVIIAHPTKSAVGFDAGVKTTLNGSTNAGTITTSGSGTRVANGEITHIAPRIMNNGKAEFTFTWTAPATEGTYFLRAVGNAVNNNGSSDGDDLWNFATPVQLMVKTASGVEKSELNPIQLDVFPNPTSDYATIKYDISSFSEATLEITDLIGRLFAKQTLINANGTTTIPLQSFLAGEYIIQMSSGTIHQTQKLIIMR
ncbi:MAG: T9SS type A sorting domain-containing protein [Bacteroidetes bacterium]|nr:T9SS type A sorting domain-containing protein [Bacteroidota bacterium]